MKHSTFEFRGKTINYRDEGSGNECIVFLHGYMNSLQVWEKYVLDYMSSMRVVAVDLIGHGESQTIEEVSSMELQAEMVKELLDFLHIRYCVMCGHSMGGMITLAFAQMYPQLLKGYCLMNSQALADSEKGKQNRLRACEIINSDKIKFIVDFIPNLFEKENRIKYAGEIEDLKSIALGTSSEGIIAAQKGMIQRRDRCDVLANSTCPVLFISGKYDIRIDVETLYAQACFPSHSETMILPTGHMSFIEEEQKVKIRLKDFVRMCFTV
ncbi:MAG: alpha/beta hydrolase [Bacteroidales bacterium]|nr:alpha/beta hydrolase [Bacteroidales bacterium]